MLFNSIIFLFGFLPLFLAGYYLLPERFRNAFALAGSIFFYAWGAPKFVFVLLTAVVFDFYLAQQISKSSSAAKKIWLWVGIAVNLSILFAFKYLNFFVDIFTSISNENYDLPQLLLPIGISFFTFHEISYLVDVYRSKRQPFSSFINYALYIFFFPQLIAGPIIRYHEIADQIHSRTDSYSTTNLLNGFFRFMIGMAKKLWIADVIGADIDTLFATDTNLIGVKAAWFLAVFNLVRIYIDFSAYSDMAIGLALILGFKFPENFDSPFISKSVSEFWQRWHMSLGRWIRDYLYLPLGGSKGNLVKTCLNLMIIFVVCGFWHGADVKYIVWGALFGIAVVAERILSNKFNIYAKGLLGVFVTFFICVHILIFFSTVNYHHAFDVMAQMYIPHPSDHSLNFSLKAKLAIVAALVISFGNLVPSVSLWSDSLYQIRHSELHWVLIGVTSAILLVMNACMLFISGYHPFLYFKF